MSSRPAAWLLAACLAASLAGCTRHAPAHESPSVPAPTTAAPTSTNGPQVNSRGHIPLAPGAGGDVIGAHGRALLSVTVRSVELDAPCTAPSAPAPSHGHYLALNVEVAPSTTFSDELAMFPIGPKDFQVLGPDGTAEGDSVGAGASCPAADEALPPIVGPGPAVTGVIVLDTALSHGVVVYLPGGWEWSF